MKKINKIKKYLVLNQVNYYFILFIFIFVFILSIITSNFEFYGFKWHYLSTPIGLIDALTGRDEELAGWLIYLYDVNAVKIEELFYVFIAILSSVGSLGYLGFVRNEK